MIPDASREKIIEALTRFDAALAIVLNGRAGKTN